MKKIHPWKKPVKQAITFVLFTLAVAVTVHCINMTVTPKYLFGSDWEPSTTQQYGFYEMETDSVDVLILGSSHSISGINPQDLYDEAGIRSYNLATSNQPVWISYYWLKEALHYQSPKAVILDCYELFLPQFSSESFTRMALDNMRIGKVKIEAVNTACAYDPLQSASGYYLNSIRYHTRWKELNEKDFSWASQIFALQTKGFGKYWDICGDEAFEPLDLSRDADSEAASFDETAEEYLDSIVSLCADEGIELILIKTPTYYESPERHVAIQNYADEHGLVFYDFNMKELYDEIGFDYAADMCNSSTTGEMNAHANPSGAQKMSFYLAKELLGVNGLVSVYDEQWEVSRAFNERCWENFNLQFEEDLLTYLSLIDQERYSIIISVKDDAALSISDEVISALQNLGFSFDMQGKYQYSYIGIRNKGSITELLNDTLIESSGALRNGVVPYFVTSAGYNCGNSSSILIDGTEYSLNKRGLNIVIYDDEIRCVVDAVCFDTLDEAWNAYR